MQMPKTNICALVYIDPVSFCIFITSIRSCQRYFVNKMEKSLHIDPLSAFGLSISGRYRRTRILLVLSHALRSRFRGRPTGDLSRFYQFPYDKYLVEISLLSTNTTYFNYINICLHLWTA
jgi:hypothetical protein